MYMREDVTRLVARIYLCTSADTVALAAVLPSYRRSTLALSSNVQSS